MLRVSTKRPYHAALNSCETTSSAQLNGTEGSGKRWIGLDFYKSKRERGCKGKWG